MDGAVSMIVHHSGAPPNAGARTASAPESEPAPQNPVTRTSSEGRLRAIVDAHFDFIWRSLRALGIPAASTDDACQQVFIIASRKLEMIAAGSERSFLFATARGVAANARRSGSRNREEANPVALDAEIDRAPNPEQAASQSQAKKLLEMILSGMQEDMRTAFVLFELEGMTTAQIAELLDVPMGTVASRLRRAREHFEREALRIQQASNGGQR